MAKPIDGLDYLAQPAKHPARGVNVLFGDESFLKRQVLAELKEQVLPEGDAEFSVSTFTGRGASWRDITDALATRALFGGGRNLAILEEADEFVSQNRPALEQYVARPKDSSLLVLEVKTWPATTKLYKALAETGLQI